MTKAYFVIHNVIFVGAFVLIGAGIWMWLGAAAGLIAVGALLLFLLAVVHEMKTTAEKQLKQFEQRRMADASRRE